MREIITTGANVEQAVAEACERLGVERDNVSVEVLEMPQKKLFGMSPAKVRVVAEDEPEQPAVAAAAPSAPAAHAPREKAERRVEFTPSEPETETPAEMTESVSRAFEYFKTLADKLGAKQISFEAVTTESGLKFKADGEDAALLIGRRGETMEALQYLCSLVYNRGEKEYGRVIVDVANYRKKREKSLQQLAKNTAIKVLRTKRSQTLEPMNPYERRIVHSAIQLINGVKSESTGEEPRRRVVVIPEAGGKGRYNNRPRRSGERNFEHKKPAEQQEKAAEQAKPAAPSKPAEAGELPLYSKIEL